MGFGFAKISNSKTKFNLIKIKFIYLWTLKANTEY